jgi:hypothetical protein
MTRVVIATVVLVVSACYRGRTVPETSPEVEKLRWVAHANVQEDFRQHVEREHDTRLLSVFGLSFASEFPGLQDTPEMRRLIQEHGSRRLRARLTWSAAMSRACCSSRSFTTPCVTTACYSATLNARNRPNQALQRTAELQGPLTPVSFRAKSRNL